MDDAAQFDQRVTMAIAWLARFKSPHPSFNSPLVTREMIRQGNVSNLRDARRLGLALFEDEKAKAREHHPGKDEWQHHVATMARLRGISLAEAEAQCRSEISAEQQPDPAVSSENRQDDGAGWV